MATAAALCSPRALCVRRRACSVAASRHADVPRRSADPRRGRHEGRQATGRQAGHDADQDSVLPISYGDAQPLLAALAGPVAPERLAWRPPDHLSLRPRRGARPSQAHVRLGLKTLYDVIARFPAPPKPDQWIIRGNHHDAWVNGAEDPISGQVAELEEARALGMLYKQGWRPKRTIIYASWDGEEPGLLGSTEWAEAHADELARTRSRTSTATPTAAATSASKARTHSSRSSMASRRTSSTRNRTSARGSGIRRRCWCAATPMRARGRPADWRVRLRLGLHTVPAALGHRVNEPRLRWRGQRRHLPLDLR